MRVDCIYKISSRPLIFAGNGNCFKKISKEIYNGGVIFLWHPSWNISIKSIFKLFWTNLYFKILGNKLIICCNSKTELKLCRFFKLNSKLFNQNMHECEYEFNIIKRRKVYDAIYFAQARKFKRMHLASEIKKLYILTYGCKNFMNSDGNDLSIFEPLIGHAEWNKSYINDKDLLSKLICSSHCGLALSKKEGAMWASVQYLLCGIPLVTTPSKGGRDYFFDDYYVVMVKDNSEAVLNGVNIVKNGNYDPSKIREIILKKIIKHRYEFLDFIIKNFLNRKTDIDQLYDFIWGGNIGIKKHLHA